MLVIVQPTQEELAVQEACGWPFTLPSWASWTATEMVNYIETSVTDLASAIVVLKAMARMLAYLRDFSGVLR